MIRVGIITDEYHLRKKLGELLNYLRNLVKITLYVEEFHFLNLNNIEFKEDIFFVKAKGDLVLNLIKTIERETGIPVINSSRSIWLAFNRFLNGTLLDKAGVRVPNFSINPLEVDPLFDNFIAKNAIDQKNYAFKPTIERINDTVHIFDERAVNEAKEERGNYPFLYYQEYIESEWEYKVYRIGEKLFFYKQIPILVNPQKMKSRVPIEKDEELTEMAILASDTIGLRVSSMDFQRTKEGEFFLTDINSSPNFNYIKNGPKIIGDYLIQEARR